MSHPPSSNAQRYALIEQLVPRLTAALADDLVSALLFGSAAEDRLRDASDVNLLLILKRWDRAAVDGLREPLRMLRAAIHLQPMFVLEAELGAVVEAFAVKFADIARRHRVLAGADLTARLQPSRSALITRTRQELLNLELRLRERYVALSLRDEQSERALARFAGALRACAAAVLSLRGEPAADGRSALQQLAAALGPEYVRAAAAISQVREGRGSPELAAGDALLTMSELAQRALAWLHELAP